jgi:riboflavin kinase / FMN adenylyltransferase
VRIWRGLDGVPADIPRTVVTIGNFDGVHRGHQHVLSAAHEVAQRLGGLPVVAVTFEPHPLQVLAPDRAPPRLSSLDQRLALLEHQGVDVTLVLDFTDDLARVSPTDFARDVVFYRLRAAAVVVGENFRFGHRARGDVALLRELAAGTDIEIAGVALERSRDQPWSSSVVRARLDAGDVEGAAEGLGRCFSVTGRVVRGHQRGRELLGYPTANVPVQTPGTAVPADGVYAGWLRRVDGVEGTMPAAISVGSNPTFDGTDRTVEAYVLDRDDLELYGVDVEIIFVRRLRGMVRFDAIDALIKQMDADVAEARTFLTPRTPGT